MVKFKLISFSNDLPKKFKWINWFILLPILLWPLVIFGSIFFFDDPNADPILVWALFLGVNLYPAFLLILFELNARLYNKVNIAGYVLPLLILGILSYGFLNEYISSKQFANERRIEREKRERAGYLGTCDTYRIMDKIVYYKDSVLSGNPSTFVYLGCHYAKDKFRVYKGKEEIRGSDAESFEIVNWQWQKDKNRYYLNGVAMKNIDYQTFEILELSYSKDKNKVYYKHKIVEAANPRTFKINRMNGIGTDGRNSFERGKRITNH